jgi:Spy/CpxP family protein refolding chaperone
MFESKRFWIILAGILSFLNISLIAGFIFLFINRPISPEPQQDPIFQLGSRLNLSDEQKDALHEEMNPEDQKNVHFQIMKYRNELIQLAQNDSVDNHLIDSLIHEIASMHAEMETETFARLQKLYRVANENQRFKLRKMMDSRNKHMERMSKRNAQKRLEQKTRNPEHKQRTTNSN